MWISTVKDLSLSLFEKVINMACFFIFRYSRSLVFIYSCKRISVNSRYVGFDCFAVLFFLNLICSHFYLFIYLFPQPEQPQLSQPVYTGEVFQLFDHPWDFPFKPIQKINVFVMQLSAVLQVECQETGIEAGGITSLNKQLCSL